MIFIIESGSIFSNVLPNNNIRSSKNYSVWYFSKFLVSFWNSLNAPLSSSFIALEGFKANSIYIGCKCPFPNFKTFSKNTIILSENFQSVEAPAFSTSPFILPPPSKLFFHINSLLIAVCRLTKCKS